MRTSGRIQSAFDGTLTVVTGAASGLGFALARTLVASGARVIGVDRNGETLASIGAELGDSFRSVKADVSDFESYGRELRACPWFGEGVDFLFNNAGITLLGESHRIPLNRWDEVFRVNLLGCVHGIQLVYPSMVSRKKGWIVNTASLAGFTGYATAAAYAASKAGILELSRSLRAEARFHGVGVAAACPGYVETGIFSADRFIGADRDKVMEHLPMKAMDAEKAAIELLEGVALGRQLIIFPFSAKVMWLISNWMPFLIAPMQRQLIASLRNAPHPLSGSP